MSLRDTGRRLRLRRTGRIPPDARVRHYDELDDDEQRVVRQLAGEPWTAPDDGYVVKFTDYYRVRSR